MAAELWRAQLRNVCPTCYSTKSRSMNQPGPEQGSIGSTDLHGYHRNGAASSCSKKAGACNCAPMAMPVFGIVDRLDRREQLLVGSARFVVERLAGDGNHWQTVEVFSFDQRIERLRQSTVVVVVHPQREIEDRSAALASAL